MKAAFEQIGPNDGLDRGAKLVWAVANTCREALILASKRATSFHSEKVPPDHFKTCDAKSGWVKKVGPKVASYETILV